MPEHDAADVPPLTPEQQALVREYADACHRTQRYGDVVINACVAIMREEDEATRARLEEVVEEAGNEQRRANLEARDVWARLVGNAPAVAS